MAIKLPWEESARRGRRPRSGKAAKLRLHHAKKTWTDPERRTVVLAKRKARRGAVEERATSVALEAVRTAVIPEVVVEGDVDLLGRVRRLPPGARRLLYVLVDPVFAAVPMAEVASQAAMPYRMARNLILHSEPFIALVETVRKAAYRDERRRLAAKIISNAMTDLDSYAGVEGAGQLAASLVKTREQAATIVGLKVAEPKVAVQLGKQEHTHRFEDVPEDRALFWAETGQWKPEWGPPPWRKR